MIRRALTYRLTLGPRGWTVLLVALAALTAVSTLQPLTKLLTVACCGAAWWLLFRRRLGLVR